MIKWLGNMYPSWYVICEAPVSFRPRTPGFDYLITTRRYFPLFHRVVKDISCLTDGFAPEAIV